MGQRTQLIIIKDRTNYEGTVRHIGVLHGQWGIGPGVVVDTMNLILNSALTGHTGFLNFGNSSEYATACKLPSHSCDMTLETKYYNSKQLRKPYQDTSRTARLFMGDFNDFDNNNGGAIIWTMSDAARYQIYYGFLAGYEETESAFTAKADFLTAAQYMYPYLNKDTTTAAEEALLVPLFDNAVRLVNAKRLTKDVSFQKWLKEN